MIDVLERERACLLGEEVAEPDALVDQRVIPRELLEAMIAEAVYAAVAHVRDGDEAVARQHGRDRGAHAALLPVAPRRGEDAAVRELDARDEQREP